jgi:hypothetical protein
MKVLFVSDYKYEVKDGLWAAINILGYDRYNIGDDIPNFEKYDFLLGHGAFHSRVDMLLRTLPNLKFRKGLCIGGNVHEQDTESYDVLFYETEWVRKFLKLQGNLVHAFGINSEIFNKDDMTLNRYRAIDTLSVGSFAKWKRHEKIINEKGNRVVIGEIQKNNKAESMEIINELLSKGVGVIPQMSTERLARYYQNAKCVYVPADIYGGGERAVLEARASECIVKIEEDNLKLKELLESPLWSEHYYAKQLKYGIETYGK